MKKIVFVLSVMLVAVICLAMVSLTFATAANFYLQGQMSTFLGEPYAYGRCVPVQSLVTEDFAGEFLFYLGQYDRYRDAGWQPVLNGVVVPNVPLQEIPNVEKYCDPNRDGEQNL